MTRPIGKLSKTNVPCSAIHKIEQRKQTIKQACQDSQIAKNILLRQYIHMRDIFGINYAGVKLRPTYEEPF